MPTNTITKGLTQYLPNLYLVDLDLPEQEGSRQFISCWIYKDNQSTFVVDPGPTATIPILLKALHTLNIEQIDYILLTHIHLDHGGGTGTLLKSFPQAKINCHPIGIPHLIAPKKLWEGSLKVLGNLAELYAEPEPVPENSLQNQYAINLKEDIINVIETPGHAAHHVCYQLRDILFAGEVAGINVPLAGNTYLRIATPPRFIYEVYKKSLQRAARLSAKYVCFGHHGMRDDPENVFSAAESQLELWMAVIKNHAELTVPFNEETVYEELINTDPALKFYPKLDADIQQREKSFCLHSIRGLHQYNRRDQ